MPASRFAAVLFDLDGTLTDSAPQLAASANALRTARGMPPLPFAALREAAGKGARGLINAALRVAPEATSFDGLKTEFLANYESRLAEEAVLFPGIAELLAELTRAGIPWGIVTNKAEHLAHLILESSPVLQEAQCLVGGDTTGKMKPAPDSIKEGLKRLGVSAHSALYAGDDERDMIAARAAGTAAAALSWGYVAGGPLSIDRWGADIVVRHPAELADFVFGRRPL